MHALRSVDVWHSSSTDYPRSSSIVCMMETVDTTSSDDAADSITGTYELVQLILENLEIHDLVVATRVCKQWQHRIINNKHLRKRLVFGRLNSTDQSSPVRDRIYRYGLEYRKMRPGEPPAIVARGTLLVSLRNGIETVLRVWHQRDFVLRRRVGVYRLIEGNVLKYSSDHNPTHLEQRREGSGWTTTQEIETDLLRLPGNVMRAICK